MGAVDQRLIGREQEVAAVARFLDASDQRTSALVIGGDIGIGKTSLWNHAISQATACGYRVLRSAPSEADSGLPYAVLDDLFDPLPEAALESLPEPLRKALEVALFRAPADQLPVDQLAVCTAALRVLRSLAVEQPILIACDDLQWTDAPSLRVLAFAVHRLAEQVHVIATSRGPANGTAAATLAKAVGHDRLSGVELGPLSFRAIDDLLLARLPRPLTAPELDKAYAASGGNPFFALEIGRFLLDHPGVASRGDPVPIPQSLAEAVNTRVANLPPETYDLLVGAAALARPDAAVLRRADPRSGRLLQPAFEAQVLQQTGGRLSFSHPLVASVIYNSAPSERVRRWHRRLAGLVEDAEEQARHLALATTAPDGNVAQALEAAARSANARGAPDAAASLALRAAELTPPEWTHEIQRRLTVSAEFRLRSGDTEGARQQLQGALTAGPHSARALRLIGSIMFTAGRLDDAEHYLTEALQQASSDSDESALIQRDLVLTINQQGKTVKALEHSERLSEIAERSGKQWLVDLAIRTRAATERYAGRVSPRARQVAIDLADGRISVATEDTPGRLHPLLEWGCVLKWSDDFARARRLFKQALELTEGRDDSLRAPILFHAAEMECWAGDWLLASLYAEECRKAVAHTGQQAYRRLPLAVQALLHLCRGQLVEARAAAQQALQLAIDVGDEPYRRRSLAILGATALVARDPRTAEVWFKQLRARFPITGEHSAGIVRSEGDEVETLIALGRLEEAADVCARLACDEQVIGDPWQRAIGARCRAVLAAARGDQAAAAREFEAALAAHQHLGMPLEAARTHLAYAISLRRNRQKRLAREHLESAIFTFRALGAGAWLPAAEAELARVAPRAAGLTELTPTETRVVALVVEGRTNKEIAAALFLSLKTVEANLSRVYAKLGVRSRSELVARRR